jgi:nitronate monooxygenase
MKVPILIQGGMGVAVSDWRLARSVSGTGNLGVVSGTAIDGVLALRLQNGDPGGHMRRALEHFPQPKIAADILAHYYIPGGKVDDEPYCTLSMLKLDSDQDRLNLIIVANFVEVYLAKEGHDGIVGINYLEKIQLPILPSLYGAMLAGVDYVLMGAGIPRAIPGILDKLVLHQTVSLKLNVDGATSEDNFEIFFDPQSINIQPQPTLKRPKFLAIVSSSVLATTLAKKSTGKIDGFVIENFTAGGHNAPPRGTLTLDENGEPLYGPRDQVNLDEIKKLGLPFWLAGSFASPEKLKKALKQGAQGIQIGTVFAFCHESGLDNKIKTRVIQKALAGNIKVFTDPFASPTGFPFKVIELEGSLSDSNVYENRQRVCDLGYLRSAYKKEDGSLGFRCPGEPVDIYIHKGGQIEDTIGRKCLCNAMVSNIGLSHVRNNGYVEKPLVTSSADVSHIARFVKNGQSSYSSADVINYLLKSDTKN